MLNCAASLALSAQSRCVSLCSIHDARSVAERQLTRRLGHAKIKNKLLILHFARLAVILNKSRGASGMPKSKTSY
jgi:hypothetical protein